MFVATAKSRSPHPACLHFMASTTSCGVVHHILPIISRSPDWLDAHYFSYNNMPSYSYAPNLSVCMHIIIILQRERSQSSHKVPKRRRLAPSWDAVDDRLPHQLVHGAPGAWGAWVGLWGFLWWAPSVKRKDHHGVSSGWSNVWHRPNIGLSSTQYEQIPIILGVWPFWLTPFFFSVNNILARLWLNCISSVEITLFLRADIFLQHRALFLC